MVVCIREDIWNRLGMSGISLIYSITSVNTIACRGRYTSMLLFLVINPNETSECNIMLVSTLSVEIESAGIRNISIQYIPTYKIENYIHSLLICSRSILDDSQYIFYVFC